MPEQLLFGREQECAHVAGLLSAARDGRSEALVLRGTAGIGKSALCRWAAEHATGTTVMSIRSVEAESNLAFAGLSDLLRPLLPRLGSIPGPQAAALSAAFALHPGPPVTPFAVRAATLSLLVEGTAASPLLVVVDDAQWLDEPSLAALLFAARRLHAEGIAILLAVEDGVRVAAVDDSLLPALLLEGLDAEAGAALLRSRHTEISDAAVQRLMAETCGNPLGLIEISRQLTAEQLRGRPPLGDHLPLGPRLERLMGDKLADLPDATRQALVVASASGTSDLHVIVPALRCIGGEPQDLEPAETSGVVSLLGGELEFTHPLLRSAIYQRASGPARRSAHRALAEVAQGDRRAWHLAAAAVGPDESVARDLETAGHHAREVGGHGSAAAAFERAAAHSPDTGDQARRLWEAATELEMAGELPHALSVLERAVELAIDPGLRADIQLVRGRITKWTGQAMAAHALLTQEADRIRPLDPRRAALLCAEAVLPCYMAGEIVCGVATARRAFALAAPAGGPAATLGALVLGHSLVLAGEAAEGYPLLLDALDQMDDAARTPLVQWVAYAGHCLTWVEDYGRARDLFDRMIREARDHSALALLAYALLVRSELDFRTGRWLHVQADAAEALTLAEEVGQAAVQGAAASMLAFLEAAQGRGADCRAHLATTAAIGDRFGLPSFHVYAGAALGHLELALGRIERAIAQFQQVAELVAQMRLGEPGTVLWQADFIEAHIRAGHLDPARSALKKFEEDGERTGRRWVRATALRCAGLLAVEQDVDEQFHTALRVHETLPMPFEQARTRLCYGEQLRRTGRRSAAREQLTQALATFEALGAQPWSRRTYAELQATGVRTPRHGPSQDRQTLTPQELQVGLAVAQGMSNKEAAAFLFLSHKTVEFHLSNAYRKLSVRSRTQLARRLADRSQPPVAAEHPMPHQC